ncbi:Uncharacterised protein [Urinicoccus massiliensis]|uniref:Uncharacterized protein n=1 Tax=Urinicoccus massiliensis TaxID=1723382 RepID=A0A8H2QZ46_9FIRM|nr:hypothetical protein [Urinicoccus massiliensis]VFB17399.1 Uncharacterised protein [Urinicoccus massiliensis]
MKTIKTSQIIDEINSNFAKTYKNATNFVDSGEFWNFCMKTIEDPISLGNIVFANDMGVPPVKSLLTIYERTCSPERDFTATESQCMGALMGFVFKFVLDYKDQNERCSVNKLGVITATKFLNGSIWAFEK